MKCVAMSLTAVFLLCGISYGQPAPGPNFEHLKMQGPTIGTWKYEGELLEDVEGIAKKGSSYVTQISWRWILNKNAVELNWFAEYADGTKISGKGLIGWNAAEEKISYGGLDSIGNMNLGTIVFDKGGRVSTLTAKGIDSEGKATEFEGVVKKTGKDTITWQALKRIGGKTEGESPVYTLTRVPRVKPANAAK